MSRARTSATTVAPVRSAMNAGWPSCKRPERVGALDPVVDRLAVRADHVDRAAERGLREPGGNLGEPLPEARVEAADRLDGRLRRRQRRADRRVKLGRELGRHVGPQVGDERLPVELEVGSDRLDRVERRA